MTSDRERERGRERGRGRREGKGEGRQARQSEKTAVFQQAH